MAELLAGAVLGVAVQQLYLAILNAIGSASRFKFILTNLKIKLDMVIPKILEIDNLIQRLDADSPKEEIHSLTRLLKKAQFLVSTCSEIKNWNIYHQYKYEKRLKTLDESLGLALQVHLTMEWMTILGILAKMVGNNKKLDRDVELIEQDCSATEGNSSNAVIASEGISARLRFCLSYRKKHKYGEEHIILGVWN